MAIRKYVAKGVKHLLKNSDEVVKNGAKNGAKKAAPRVLNKLDYEGAAGGHSGFGRFKADMAVSDDKRKGLQKPLFRDEGGDLYYHQSNGNKPSQFRKRDTKQQEVLDRDQNHLGKDRK